MPPEPRLPSPEAAALGVDLRVGEERAANSLQVADADLATGFVDREVGKRLCLAPAKHCARHCC